MEEEAELLVRGARGAVELLDGAVRERLLRRGDAQHRLGGAAQLGLDALERRREETEQLRRRRLHPRREHRLARAHVRGGQLRHPRRLGKEGVQPRRRLRQLAPHARRARLPAPAQLRQHRVDAQHQQTRRRRQRALLPQLQLPARLRGLLEAAVALGVHPPPHRAPRGRVGAAPARTPVAAARSARDLACHLRASRFEGGRELLHGVGTARIERPRCRLYGGARGLGCERRHVRDGDLARLQRRREGRVQPALRLSGGVGGLVQRLVGNLLRSARGACQAVLAGGHHLVEVGSDALPTRGQPSVDGPQQRLLHRAQVLLGTSQLRRYPLVADGHEKPLVPRCATHQQSRGLLAR